MAADDKCGVCTHRRDAHHNAQCDGEKGVKCGCTKFKIKDWKWWARKLNWTIPLFVVGTFLLALSLFVDTAQVKESTVLSSNNNSIVGFYLEGGKFYNLFVTIEFGGTSPSISIKPPMGGILPLPPDNGEVSHYRKYSFQTTESGIYDFIASAETGKWVTFAVKEKTNIPSFIPAFYAQVLSFAGGGLIGFIIPIIHSRYQSGRIEGLVNDPAQP